MVVLMVYKNAKLLFKVASNPIFSMLTNLELKLTLLNLLAISQF